MLQKLHFFWKWVLVFSHPVSKSNGCVQLENGLEPRKKRTKIELGSKPIFLSTNNWQTNGFLLAVWAPSASVALLSYNYTPPCIKNVSLSESSLFQTASQGWYRLFELPGHFCSTENGSHGPLMISQRSVSLHCPYSRSNVTKSPKSRPSGEHAK